ncbi:MAG TPA: hypothetical protein EYP64_00535 [Desulfarculaceae bacterium]|nr:hypothetical protein [Desulfarculaceae bacterium]
MCKQKRKIFWAGLIGLALGALLLGACKDSSVGLKFSHKLHIEEQEATCDQCHMTDDDGNRLAATMDQCGECHDINTDEPSEDCLVCHTPQSAAKDYEIEKLEKPERFADLIFSHEVHSDFKCEECHQAIAKEKGLSSGPSMPLCLKCHKEQDSPQDCESCHEEIRLEKEPESHSKDWEAQHGFASNLDTSCNYCHPNRQAFCEKCHRTEKPKDHIFSWKTTGHGVEATHDRRLCANCHDAGYCTDCHKRQKPVSHFRGNWMSYQRENGHGEAAHRNFRSCNVCHETGECMKCHKGIILRKK